MKEVKEVEAVEAETGVVMMAMAAMAAMTTMAMKEEGVMMDMVAGGAVRVSFWYRAL